MNYMKYNRTLVMLEEQSSDFCAKEGPMKGHLKVETGNGKGALRCTVQNLRYYPRGEYIYKLILFGRKGERTLHTIIGNLVVNRYGNSETYFRFNPVNVDDKGNSFEDYFAAIVAAVSTRDAKEPLHPVLKGILENSGSPNLRRSSPAESRGPGRDAGSEAEQEDGVLEFQGKEYPKQEVKAASASDSLGGESAEASARGTAEMLEEVGDEAEGTPAVVEETSAADFGTETAEPAASDVQVEAKTEPAETKKNYNGYYNEYLLNVCGYTCKVADYYEDVVPFQNDRTGARWKKIVNVANLPLVSPGAHYFATQYHHYLFGAKAGADGTAEKYYFGVPGRFLETEQPDGGRSGFTFWQPVKGADREKNSYGYWIVCVDAKTGAIEDAQ